MEVKKLKECCTIIAGQSPESKYYNSNGDGLPFFQGKADFGELYPSIRVYCSQPTKIAEKDDILLSVRAPVGPTNLAPCKVCIGRGLTAIRPSEVLLTRYVLLFFRYFEAQLASKGAGTTFKAITQDVVKNLEIPIPPLPEQERIVARIEELFSQLDAGVETLKKTKAEIVLYRQAVFSSVIPQEESFRLLSRRKNIYITTMDRAQHEKAQEFDYFKAFFPHTVEIKDLREEEKVELLKCAAKEYGFTFDAKSFRNSDILKLPYPTLQTQLYSVIQNQLADADNTEFIMHASDFDPLAKKSDKKSNALEELDALIGLDSVKKCVREIVALLKNRGRSALPCLHMVFRGNPGTGKTTVARLVGKLFGEIGIIKNGEKFIETDRDGLVSQYLGGTAAKTASVVKDALGGVLFIDEAYALVSNAAYDYGHEAINTLVKRLEDSRRDFVCIMAGYTNEMNQMLSSNPGLRDRIQFYIDFPDYSAEELVQIYCKYAESEAYQLGADAKVTLRQMAEQIIRNKDENFSNARLIRKVFERTRMKQAMRTSDNMISAEDIQAVFAESDMRALLDSVQVQRRIGFAG